ncbi:hypothetical protein GCM10009119_30830 [Algoriphagus jejuensis]|uniref:DUF3298 domain-containing protein n=1 Tax=Algoriphagus jejuensis TaxID=419934 RepID=A0ABN1N2K8_9BACT
MKEFISTLLFLFVLTTVFAQETFNNARHSLPEIIKYESNFNSILGDTVDFRIQEYPSKESANSISTTSYIFDRVNDTFIPRLHVWYHFDDNAHELIGVRYSWGLYNPSFDANRNRPLLEKLASDEKSFRKKYSQIHEDRKKEFGVETRNEIIVDAEHAYIQEITWELDDKIIELSISFTREIQDFPGIGLAANQFNIEEFIRFK